ncbi:helix-turn-helix domain-containing protein, partial [Streptomyces anulatus]
MTIHSTEVRQKALTLLRNGTKGADVARRLNVPRGTISYWLHIDLSL